MMHAGYIVTTRLTAILEHHIIDQSINVHMLSLGPINKSLLGVLDILSENKSFAVVLTHRQVQLL